MQTTATIQATTKPPASPRVRPNCETWIIHDTAVPYATITLTATMTAAGVCHAEVRICNPHLSDYPPFFRGYGTAGGGGYHKPSAAAYAAFRSAGITFADEISGRGNSAIVAALNAAALALNYNPSLVYHVA